MRLSNPRDTKEPPSDIRLLKGRNSSKLSRNSPKLVPPPPLSSGFQPFKPFQTAFHTESPWFQGFTEFISIPSPSSNPNVAKSSEFEASSGLPQCPYRPCSSTKKLQGYIEITTYDVSVQ